MPQGVPQGGLPPGMAPPGGQAPPANVGPHTIPQTNPGNVMQAANKLAMASKMINESISALPMGSELHDKVLKMATDLNKVLGQIKESVTQQQQMQMLAQHMQSMKQQGAQPQGMMAPSPTAGPAMPPPGGGSPSSQN
jgi:hypothetical protein